MATTPREEMKFEQVLTKAQEGDKGPWTIGELRIESLGKGAVHVERGGKYESRVPVSGVSNAWITGKVKSKLSTDSDVKAFEIDVDTDDNGIVSLHGKVASPKVAAAAIEQALTTSGVNAVKSYLKW